jgi:glutamate-1-semialdehyde 2,1-aminomutase
MFIRGNVAGSPENETHIRANGLVFDKVFEDAFRWGMPEQCQSTTGNPANGNTDGGQHMQPMDATAAPRCGALSKKLFAVAKEFIPGGVNSPVRAFRNVGGEPFFVRRAAGCRIEDIDGKTYIDYIGSWGPNILGHAPVAITNIIHEVAKSGISFGIPNPFEVEMARTICGWVPSVEKVRMCNSGTEATMSAIRLARGFTRRDLIVKFDGCYHGHSDSLLVAAGSGALTHGEPDSAGVPRAFAEKTLVLPYNDPAALEHLFATRGEQIAAIIVESYPANAGLVFPQPGYLDLLASITRNYGALLIFDEVMTGFRLGMAGVQGIENLTPDLSCFGKVIGGGLPVGAFGGRADVMDLLAPLGPVYQAGTLSGNPLAMAAGLAQLKELAGTACLQTRPAAGADTPPNGYTRLDQLGAHFESGLRALLTEKGVPHRLNRVGSMFCLFFADRDIINVSDVMKQDLEFFKKFFWGCLDKGIYLAPSPYETGFISLAHSEADLDDTLTVFGEVLTKI